MPVEYVRGEWMGDEEDGVETLVKVGWSPEAVQVACIGRATRTHDTIAASGDEGWYVTLDRYGINELIRRLRQARDKAYGRDE